MPFLKSDTKNAFNVIWIKQSAKYSVNDIKFYLYV